MNKKVSAQKARGERSILFANDNPELFAAGEAKTDLDIVKAEVANLNKFEASQQGGFNLSTGATTTKDALLRALRRTFDLIKKRDKTIIGNINLPSDHKDDSLIAAVEAALQVVTPLKAKFIARGKKADFLDRINADLAAYNLLVTKQQTGTGDRETAVDEIERSVKALIDAIESLDDIMENALEEPDEAVLLGEWKRASKLGTIERNPGNAKNPKPTTNAS